MSKNKIKKKSILQRINHSIKQMYNVLVIQNMTEQQMREYWNELIPVYVVQKRQLSKDFLREMFPNSSQIDKYISSFQHLDQKFIEQQRDRIDWGWLSIKKNNFSQQFLLKWNQKIWWDHIWTKKRKWSQEFWEYLKKKVGK